MSLSLENDEMKFVVLIVHIASASVHFRENNASPCSPQLRVDKWWGNRKELATVRTICSHVQNMIKGVTLVRLQFFELLTVTSVEPQTDCLWIICLHGLTQWLTLLSDCRVSGIKCVLCTPISPSTSLSRRLAPWWRSETSWERSTFDVSEWGVVSLQNNIVASVRSSV